MISKMTKASVTSQNPVEHENSTLETTSGDKAKSIVGSDVFVWDSVRTDTHGTSGAELKGARNLEADLRRIAIDRDLDQPDMAAAKTYQDQSDQDIVNSFRKNNDKKSER